MNEYDKAELENMANEIVDIIESHLYDVDFDNVMQFLLDHAEKMEET